MITGKTNCVGILGYPVGHSLSPVMHNAAFEKNQMDYVYIPLPTPSTELSVAVSALKAWNFRGANVTIPHKVAVMEYLDEIAEDARMIGAVNTITIRDGRAIGSNTDGIGFIASLRKAGAAPEGGKAVLLGAGGAARAVVWGLLQNGIENITILVRNVEKGSAFAERFASYGDIKVYAFGDAEAKKALRACTLLVNTTPLGMAPNLDAMPDVDWADVAEGAVVYDLIYTPLMTRFLREAQEHGHQVINGKDMLIEQGAESFFRWTGIEPHRPSMEEAFDSFWESRQKND